MTLPDVAAALRGTHTSITQQQDLTKVVIEDAENARAEFRALTAGATNPLVNRALGNYAQAIRLRDGSWLLAEAGGILAEYARTIGIELPAKQPSAGRQAPDPARDGQMEGDTGTPVQRTEPDDEPSASDAEPR
ncbi:hypothetical protein DKT69_15745 [Micromonospora sicca]|uniref:Uncharacterized protein n=1 Tax=Micromonospora sicca TaxID=2202420 RepID=A0A317DIL4_9ACTN|nr:hypothetical protein [Micromonospora sp. 4G51]PWR14579.1 hypothetical protein DKT69_15745 [Micromonospora sp. 4G51]